MLLRKHGLLIKQKYYCISVPYRMISLFLNEVLRQSRNQSCMAKAHYRNRPKSPQIGLKKDVDVKEDSFNCDLQVNPGSNKSSADTHQTAIVRAPGDNPYLKFIKKVRNVTSQQGFKRSLGQKAERITNSIIHEFLDWYNALGGAPSEIGIDRSTLEKLFQIGIDAPTAKKQSFADMDDLRNIQLDDRDAIPFIKSQEDSGENTSNLETMATVWSGIENLRSTVAFSDWLKRHSDVKPPSYLENVGLLDADYDNLLFKFEEFKSLEAELKILL